MDRFIRSFASECDADLELCHAHGVAYQRDQTQLVVYDEPYYAKCLSYEDQAIALAINAGRIQLVNRRVGSLARVCDIGIGSGEFIKKRPQTFGHDVNPVALQWLTDQGKRAQDLGAFGAYTFWDVIEHVPEPETYFRQVKLHARLFTSIPIFDTLDAIRSSRHYRPGEHLYYFCRDGFLEWMDEHGFAVLEIADFETAAGRESILSFAFRRYRWPTARK
jgi:hypothetical protein